MKFIILILLLALATQAYSQLQCYECEDCDNLDTDKATAITCTVSSSSTTELPSTSDSTTEISETTMVVSETTTEDTATTTEDDITTTEDIDPSSVLIGNDEKLINILDLKRMVQLQSKDPRVISQIFRRRRQTSTPQFRCFIVEINDNDNVKINRGCTEYSTNDKTTCDAIYDSEPLSCTLCNENECNSSSIVVSSLLAIIASILITSKLIL